MSMNPRVAAPTRLVGPVRELVAISFITFSERPGRFQPGVRLSVSIIQCQNIPLSRGEPSWAHPP